MFKKLSVAAVICCAAQTSAYAFDFAQALNQGKVEGELRTVYYGRSADGAPFFPKAGGLAGGGFIRFSTAPVNHISAQIAGYTTQKLIGSGKMLANTHLLDGTKGFSMFGELNLRYDDDRTQLIVGRQALTTPLVGSDDARVIKDLFAAAYFSSKLNDNITPHLLYVDNMSGLDNGNNNKSWVSMSKVLGTTYNRGLYAGGVDVDSGAGLQGSAWLYEIPQTVSMFYANAKYSSDAAPTLTYELHGWRSRSQSRYEADRRARGKGSTTINYFDVGARVTADLSDQFRAQLAVDLMRKSAGSHTIHTYAGNYAEYTYGFLMGSGAYGAISTGNPNSDMTRMNSVKVTLEYKFQPETKLHVGYVVMKSNMPTLQSNMNLLDIRLTSDHVFDPHVSVALLYENWHADQHQAFFINNNLARARVSYHF